MPSVKGYDIKSHMPSSEEAEAELRLILMANHDSKIIKIIHGYGSTGTGGKIKKIVHRLLEAEKAAKRIRAYIPGEATAKLMGYDELIRNHYAILKHDDDFHKGNDGITYVIF